MTYDELIARFIEDFPDTKINDFRPICHEMFSDGKVGVTIWLNNGDMIEFYPSIGGDDDEK